MAHKAGRLPGMRVKHSVVLAQWSGRKASGTIPSFSPFLLRFWLLISCTVGLKFLCRSTDHAVQLLININPVSHSTLAWMREQYEKNYVTYRYRDRYWRESTFKGVELVRSALDEAYGAGKVSLVSAAFRWLNHHSQMKPEHKGEGRGIKF